MQKLCEYAKTYEPLYKQPINNIFHTASSCVMGQQVAFNIGRVIRKDVYELCGFPLTRDAILNNDLTKIKNLTETRITLLKQMATIDEGDDAKSVLDKYVKLKGFGSWSYGAVCILMGLDDNINLSSDAYIRKNLSLYFDRVLNVKDCDNHISMVNNKSQVCYFLWRIKKSCIIKIKNDEELTNDDFI
jgi:hypothetical protein